MKRTSIETKRCNSVLCQQCNNKLENKTKKRDCIYVCVSVVGEGGGRHTRTVAVRTKST